MTSKNTILAVLAGVAAGAALGIMFAPGKGSDTRKKVHKKSEDLADALNERIDEKFAELLSSITCKANKSTAQADAGIQV
jgi:gas vesicle protein